MTCSYNADEMISLSLCKGTGAAKVGDTAIDYNAETSNFEYAARYSICDTESLTCSWASCGTGH